MAVEIMTLGTPVERIRFMEKDFTARCQQAQIVD